MNSVGTYLKRERELRGFTLEEVSRATRINIRYLKALEVDDYQSLPAEAFVKGFLRSYAQCIGLSPHEAMLVYEQCKEPGESLRDEPAAGRGGDKEGRQRPSRKLVIAGALLAACLITLAIIAAQLLDREAKEGEGPGGEGAAEVELPASRGDGELRGINGAREQDGLEGSPGPSAATASRGLPAKLTILPMRMSPQAGWSGASRMPPSYVSGEANAPWPPEGKLVLKIHALTGTWVEVRMDDLDRDERLFLPRGDTRFWAANDRILLTLGNTSGVELELNGEKVTLPDTEGNVLRNYALTRDSLQ